MCIRDSIRPCGRACSTAARGGQLFTLKGLDGKGKGGGVLQRSRRQNPRRSKFAVGIIAARRA
eukprot:10398170-Alexandrium_andersonii.AAC.1